MLVPAPVFAQQQTGQVAPQTRNPQSNAPQLFRQNNDVQSPGSQNLLNQQVEIEIPEGTPAQPAAKPAGQDDSDKRFLTLLLSLLGIIIAAILFKISRPDKVPKQPAAIVAETSEPAAVSPPVRNKKKHSKKKGKPRKKR